MYRRKTLSASLNDVVSYGALLIAFVCATNGELRYTESNLIYYFPFVVCAVALLFEMMSRRIEMTSYLVWRVLLLVFFIITLAYVADMDVGFVGVKLYALQTVVVLLIALKCSTDPRNIKKIMMIAVLACTMTVLYLVATVDLSAISSGDDRLGVTTVTEVWNANNIGTLTSFGILLIFCSVFVFSQGYTRVQLAISIALTLLFGYVMILSGSRKSFLVILVTVLLYIMRAQKSKRVQNMLMVIVVALVAIYAIYNVPFLYQHLGYRFEGLLGAVFGEGGDQSARVRQSMVRLGLEAFVEKPVLGYGINGFSILYKAETGVSAYSHNNYVEMLVTGGVVGFLLYYVYIAKILTRKVVQGRQMAFIKAILVAILIADVGSVSYYDPFLQYVLCLVVYSVINAEPLAELYGSEVDSRSLLGVRL